MSREAVFEHLVALLRRYAVHHSVKSDTPSRYYLEEHCSSAKPQLFAAAEVKARYVSLHLFPVYVRPELLTTLSPQLRARMHGKSCFNFTSLAQLPEAEMEALLAAAHKSLTNGA